MNGCHTLTETLSAHAVTVNENQREFLQRYCDHLWDWNRHLNLTRHTNYEAFVTRDLNDTQHLEKHLQPGESILDVGSGGGVPGIVLALLNPSLTVSLSECTQKKAAALKAIIAALNIPITVYSERAEDVMRRHTCDTITARAVAPLKKLLVWFHPPRRSMKRLLLIKGPSWQKEKEEAEKTGILSQVILEVLSEYHTVGRHGKSVILQVRYR